MAQISNQSEESKAIKRINERISALTKLQATENPYLSAYSRAIRETGVDYTRDSSGRYKIKNTTENRKKAAALEKRLKQLQAKTVGDIRKSAKAELQAEAKELAKSKPKSERAKFIKQYTSQSRVNERIRENLQDNTISDMLQYLYAVDYNLGIDLGVELSQLTRGVTRDNQDRGAIFDLFGRIRQAYRDDRLKQLDDSERQRDIDLKNLYRTFGDKE